MLKILKALRSLPDAPQLSTLVDHVLHNVATDMDNATVLLEKELPPASGVRVQKPQAAPKSQAPKPAAPKPRTPRNPKPAGGGESSGGGGGGAKRSRDEPSPAHEREPSPAASRFAGGHYSFEAARQRVLDHFHSTSGGAQWQHEQPPPPSPRHSLAPFSPQRHPAGSPLGSPQPGPSKAAPSVGADRALPAHLSPPQQYAGYPAVSPMPMHAAYAHHYSPQLCLQQQGAVDLMQGAQHPHAALHDT